MVDHPCIQPLSQIILQQLIVSIGKIKLKQRQWFYLYIIGHWSGQALSSELSLNNGLGCGHYSKIRKNGQAMRLQLKIFHGIPARGKNISLDVHPECQNKVNDQR